jgi:hypothetical protein
MHAQRGGELVADGDDDGGSLWNADEGRRNAQRITFLTECFDAKRGTGIPLGPPETGRGAQRQCQRLVCQQARRSSIVVGAYGRETRCFASDSFSVHGDCRRGEDY